MPDVRPGRSLLALIATLCACAVMAAGPAAPAETKVTKAAVADDLARIMGRELAALNALGATRIAAIASGRTAATAAAPTAGSRDTVATRGAAASVEPTRRILDFASLDAMPRVTGDSHWQCLAIAIYFESRGEPLAGQIGVAEVVLNRVDSRSFPNSICAVTVQGAGSGRGCQFSYVCDGRADVMTSAVPRDRAEKLARMLIDGRPRTVTDGATNFHATYVRPDWSRGFARTASIGNHVFYRQPEQVASN